MEKKLKVSCINLLMLIAVFNFSHELLAQCPPLKPQKRGKKELKAIPFTDQNNQPASKHQESFNDTLKNEQPVLTKRRRKKN